MQKSSNGPTTLSEAIEHLESAGHEHLAKDRNELKQALEILKPYLQELKKNIEKESHATKVQLEGKVKESPWMALGIVGLVALFIGWILGQSRKK